MLGLGRAPGVVQLEALVAVAGLAVHAALGGLLQLRWFADVAHDGHGGARRLPVALHDALQGEVAEQHADAALAQVDVVLAAGAGDGGDPGGHRAAAPARGRDGAWGRAEGGVRQGGVWQSPRSPGSSLWSEAPFKDVKDDNNDVLSFQITL